MSVYTLAWLSWLLMFAVIEGAALLNKTKADTLSEHVWAWFSVRDKGRGWRWRRIGLVAFLGWLVVHFLSGGSVV